MRWWEPGPACTGCVFTECQYLQFVSISLIVPNYSLASILLRYTTKTAKKLHSNHEGSFLISDWKYDLSWWHWRRRVCLSCWQDVQTLPVISLLSSASRGGTRWSSLLQTRTYFSASRSLLLSLSSNLSRALLSLNEERELRARLSTNMGVTWQLFSVSPSPQCWSGPLQSVTGWSGTSNAEIVYMESPSRRSIF